MNKKLCVLAIAITTVLVGCGDDKTAQEIAFEQEKELLQMKMEHEREMARIEASKIEAANPVAHTYVENEYELPEVSYEQPPEFDYSQTNPHLYDAPDYNHSVPTTNNVDSGYSGGDVALAVAGGLAAGYIANEILDSGHRVGTGSDGVTRYYDPKGREITRTQYEDFRAKNPVKSKARDLTVKGREQAAKAATTAADKSKQLGNKVAKSKVGQTAKKGYDKAKESTKKVVEKAKPIYHQKKKQVKRYVEKKRPNRSTSRRR